MYRGGVGFAPQPHAAGAASYSRARNGKKEKEYGGCIMHAAWASQAWMLPGLETVLAEGG